MAGVPLGQFAVGGTESEARAFRASTGLEEGSALLPFTFPIRWLVTPEIRAALMAVVDDPALVLVHESQAFEYTSRLRIGTAYGLALVARRETTPDRLFVDGVIVDAEGRQQGRIETILRLVSAPPEAAS